MKYGLLLLAAGESRRLGRPKQLLRFRGRTLLQHACLTANGAGCFAAVVVVLGAFADEIRREAGTLGATVVVNRNWKAGVGASIRRGMKEFAGFDGVVIMPCDQPFVTKALLRRLVAIHRKHGEGIVACAYGGTCGPPALFDAKYFGELKALAPEGGAKPVILRHADAIRPAAFPKGAIDIDTTEDWENNQRMTGSPSLREKIGQMLVVGFRGFEVAESDPIVRDIVERNLGAVIFFDQEMADTTRTGRNIQSPAQVKALTAALQGYATTPLLVAIDQEGGRVNRLKAAYGFPETRSHEALGAEDDLAATFAEGEKIAGALAAAGINFNLAPVVDLDAGPDNPIIKGKKRSFGADPAKVARHAEQFIAAHHRRGIRTCVKHFPGHGSARGDTHLGLVDVTETWSEQELAPFAELIRRGLCDAVMTAHVFNARLDSERPATLSRPILQGLLRGKLGFDGAILSDDMEMKAISAHYGLEQAVAYAIEAGIDLLCFGNNLNFDAEIGRRASEMIYRLVDSGAVAESRIDASYARVQRLKQKFPLR